MKDAEIREELGEIAVALNDLRLEAPASGRPMDIQPIIDSLAELDAALEANPPLAEVETEIIVGILDINVSVEDGPVTVTIRGRGGVPEPPATSSSIR